MLHLVKPFVLCIFLLYFYLELLLSNLKYYIADGGQYNDITPLRSTTGSGDVTFAATNGSSTITVTDAAHGAVLLC